MPYMAESITFEAERFHHLTLGTSTRGDAFHVSRRRQCLRPRTEGRKLTWVSLSPAVATVDSSGLIEAVSVGTAKVRVKNGRDSTEFSIDVREPSSYELNGKRVLGKWVRQVWSGSQVCHDTLSITDYTARLRHNCAGTPWVKDFGLPRTDPPFIDTRMQYLAAPLYEHWEMYLSGPDGDVLSGRIVTNPFHYPEGDPIVTSFVLCRRS